MPVIENERKTFTLFEVMNSIKKTLNDRYSSAYWVKAEMNKLNLYKHSGHCYPELVEKKDGKVIAQIRSHLWKDDYLSINEKFISTLHEPLKDGIKVLILVRIAFEPEHGLALHILDIDPYYTMGDLEKEKQETISRLRAEGIFYNNKSLTLPLLPQRIAIISVESSKGYADFLKILENNPRKYQFFQMLFPSVLQGDNAVPGIIQQLKRIKKVIHHFDAVAIIRGGGGDIGLSCYNNYRLAKQIALFPLPVITGIGHVTNETVTEQISFSNAITPTKLAEYLIQLFNDFAMPVRKAEDVLFERAKRLLHDNRIQFQSELKLFRSVTVTIVNDNKHQLRSLTQSLVRQARFVFQNNRVSLQRIRNDIRKNTEVFFPASRQRVVHIENVLRKEVNERFGQLKNNIIQYLHQLFRSSTYQLLTKKEKVVHIEEKMTDSAYRRIKFSNSELNAIEKNLRNIDPQNVLNRGYSITLLNGRAIKNISQVEKDDQLTTLIADGSINSTITTTKEFTHE
ncbi:MAG TPA: exodeoxyribonuclease VII large subunit [Flavitalea sp.]|nr:exodeoxyribonuclease VII large subunit [Flavitalea sp.]